MKWSHWLEEWGMSSLKIKLAFLEAEFKPNDVDRNAAWEMYVELLTRVTTQALPLEHGNEQTALTSIYSLFETTRDVISVRPQTRIFRQDQGAPISKSAAYTNM